LSCADRDRIVLAPNILNNVGMQSAPTSRVMLLLYVYC
jgi:hypothetical protein